MAKELSYSELDGTSSQDGVLTKYSFLSYEEYKADKDSMSGTDKQIHSSFSYQDNGMNDTQQIIASLRCIIPDTDELEKQFETLVKERGLAKAYSKDK